MADGNKNGGRKDVFPWPSFCATFSFDQQNRTVMLQRTGRDVEMTGADKAQIENIDIGTVVPALICAPIWLAEQRGFLREEGISARLRSFGSTDGVTDALREGRVSVTMGSPEGAILDALNGGDLRLCAGFVNKPPLSMIAQPRYRSLDELRGARLGTTSLKEGTCHLMERMLAAHGLHQPKDFQFVMAGAHPQRWEALQAGTLDAAIQLVPFNYIAEEAGFPNLGDVDEYVPDFLFCAICTRLSWAETHAALLTCLLRALRRGAEALYADPDGAAAIVANEMRVKPEHARRACREFVGKAVIPRDLSINPAAFATTVEALRRSNLIDEDRPLPKLQDCADLRFLDGG
jgi:ABC-type nitrate/sulfonate/bicarbonate transport system substrate-binding protein